MGGELASRVILIARYPHGLHACSFGKQGDFGLKFDMLVGDVKGQYAARCKVPLVESDCLRGQQVKGNGIA